MGISTDTTTTTTTITEKQYDLSIHWFRNGLRLHDNPSLLAASQSSHSVLPLVVIDPQAPFAQTTHRRAGILRANFILESLHALNTQLQQQQQELQSQLCVVLGDPREVIPQVVQALSAQALFYEKDMAAPVRAVDRQVRQHVQKLSCDIRAFDSQTLFPLDTYLSNCKQQVAPSTYGGFTKIFQRLTVPPEVEPVTQLPPPPSRDVLISKLGFLLRRDSDTSKENNAFAIPSLTALGYTNTEQPEDGLQHRGKGGFDFMGGETAGLQLLETMMQRHQWVATFEKPKTSPNALTVDTTGLSPYVKHGCVSPRRFFHALSAVYTKFPARERSKPPVSLHGQLMWREYNYLMGYSTPNFDQMVDNPVARQIPWDDDPALLQAWRNSQTGYPFIDAIMTQLRETGWIHHLARHAVACFLTRGDLWQSWEKGAEVFEELLIDADWSINNFNWQWLSCTAHFYQYFRCYSPVAFGKKTDPNGNYIRKWLPQFKNMPKAFIYTPWEAPIEVQRKCGVVIGKDYPPPIVDHSVISKANMGRMKQAYDQQNGAIAAPSAAPREPARNESGRKRRRT